MNDEQTTPEIDQQTLIEKYIVALKERDVSRCVDCFSDDAEIHFMSGVFKGRSALEEWHRDRFDADMELVKVKKIKVKGQKVTIDGEVTSKKIRAWKIGKLAGKVTFSVQDGKITETKFSVRMYNPIAGF